MLCSYGADLDPAPAKHDHPERRTDTTARDGHGLHSQAKELQPYTHQSTTFKGRLSMLRNFFAHEEGQGLVEYALILALVAIAVIALLLTLGGELQGIFGDVNDTLQDRPA